MFKSHNQNPKGKRVGDCVIRAISYVSGKTWEEVLTELYKIALDFKSLPNDVDVYSGYLETLGFRRQAVKTVNRRKPTVTQFAYSHPEGTFLVRVNRHLTVVKDGDWYDIWDCGHKKIFRIWEVV